MQPFVMGWDVQGQGKAAVRHLRQMHHMPQQRGAVLTCQPGLTAAALDDMTFFCVSPSPIDSPTYQTWNCDLAPQPAMRPGVMQAAVGMAPDPHAFPIMTLLFQ